MNHLQRYLVEEFVEDYQEGLLTRRQALKLIAGITGATVAAQLLAACGAQPQAQAPTAGTSPTSAPAATAAATDAPAATAAATSAPAATAGASPTGAPAAPAATTPPQSPDSVAEGDPAVVSERVTFPGADGQLMGYLARPSAQGTFPIVLVCHENRGLTPHIEDVTRRLAKAGYVGLAVDLLSREGGTAAVKTPENIPGLLSGAPPQRHVQDFQAGLKYVQAQSYARADRAGMVGFCFGGGVTWLSAAGIPELRAAVPFYGPPPTPDDYAKINAAVLAIYAANDQRITGTLESVKAIMANQKKTFREVVYPGVDHAFHNDTGQRYNQQAAQAAWGETLAWFKQYLQS